MKSKKTLMEDEPVPGFIVIELNFKSTVKWIWAVDAQPIINALPPLIAKGVQLDHLAASIITGLSKSFEEFHDQKHALDSHFWVGDHEVFGEELDSGERVEHLGYGQLAVGGNAYLGFGKEKSRLWLDKNIREHFTVLLHEKRAFEQNEKFTSALHDQLRALKEAHEIQSVLVLTNKNPTVKVRRQRV